MESLFELIGRSRQDYHQSIVRQAQKQRIDESIVKLAKDWRKNHPGMGSRIMFYSMQNHDIDLKMGVNSFEKLMSRNNLTIKKVKRSSPLTSDGKGKANYENLICGLSIDDINQVLVGDITYFWVEDSWHYIFTLKDLYSQRVISLVPTRDMKTSNAMKCLKTLVKLRGLDALAGCIHHSDNGSQYNAKSYTDEILKCKMLISRAESCQQNGSAEQLNHIVKNMYLNHWGIRTFRQLQEACKEIQYLMNEERVVAQLGNITPIMFENEILSIPRNKRKIKKLHDFKTK